MCTVRCTVDTRVPCLWKLGCKDYRGRSQLPREEARLRHLMGKKKESEPWADRNSLRRKIDAVRTAFRKEASPNHRFLSRATRAFVLVIPWLFTAQLTMTSMCGNHRFPCTDLDRFGVYVAAKLKRLSSEQSIIAEKVIAEVLLRANLGTLEGTTTLTEATTTIS
ncbi:uncharacterized protein LOC131665046 [Phymastichus coffea]|uniref:uncharacterized protein LOC131665046 n=1 Tax=Phymastichus coffea TaxID=108790 RepID=UPI00273B6A90|nr:uncharacterized protein LOC131665046 [Phymastichus coffea]